MTTRTIDADYSAVLAEIRAHLARQRLSAQEIGARTGIPQATMSRRMAGINPFTMPEIIAVCRALGVPLIELLEDAKRHQRPTALPQKDSNFQPADYHLQAVA